MPEGMIDVSELVLICLECKAVRVGRTDLSCPVCGGKIVRVRKGTEQAALKEIEQRGTTNYAL
jgi:Zn finger protein HypA/HybF involved in hydrogenase expression